MKYINVDKLIAEIERRRLSNRYIDTEGYENELLDIINSLQQEQSEVDLFERPETPIKDAVEVTSRMQHIDDDIKPIAEFILNYASWNLHKDEWNQPVIEVPLFRVLDALVQRGKPYCCAG